MNTEDYKNTVRYPDKPKKPTLGMKATAAEARAYANALEQWEIQMVLYRKAQEAWSTEEARMNDKFKADVLAENGLTGHPKADKLYAMAWSHGHSSGYDEVAYWVKELAELVL